MKLEINKIDHTSYLRYSVAINSACKIDVIPFFSGNCQLTSIAYAKSPYNFYLSLKEILYYLRKNNSVIFPTKSIFLDVQKEYIQNIKDDFKDCNILLKAEYMSSNGSSMCIFIIELPIKK